MRQIVLDTETTGLSAAEGHRIIEVAAVELINRRLTGQHYHQYICPEREIDAEAVAIHGITKEFLADKPLFSAISDTLLTFLSGAELVIHNAPFDVSFLNHEFKRANPNFTTMVEHCGVLDTLALARKKHPGQQNSLDALCRRYKIDNSARNLHGALMDTHLLTEVYLAMTGGQATLFGGELDTYDLSHSHQNKMASIQVAISSKSSLTLPIIKADEQELKAHGAQLEILQKASNGACLWLKNFTVDS